MKLPSACTDELSQRVIERSIRDRRGVGSARTSALN